MTVAGHMTAAGGLVPGLLGQLSGIRRQPCFTSTIGGQRPVGR